MVNSDFQCNLIWSHLGDTPLGLSVSAFPEALAKEGRPILDVGDTSQYRLNKKQEVS